MGNCTPNSDNCHTDLRASEHSEKETKLDLESFIKNLEENKLEGERLLK